MAPTVAAASRGRKRRAGIGLGEQGEHGKADAAPAFLLSHWDGESKSSRSAGSEWWLGLRYGFRAVPSNTAHRAPLAEDGPTQRTSRLHKGPGVTGADGAGA